MQAMGELGSFDRVGLFSNSLSAPKSLNSVNNLGSKYSKNCSLSGVNGKLNSKSDFNFKYVSEPELKAVVKRVRRANQKKRDEEEWKCFIKLKQEKDTDISREGSVCDICTARERESACCGQCGLLELASSITRSTVIHQEVPLNGEEDEAAKRVIQTAVLEDDNTSHTYQLGPGLTKRLQDLLSTIGKMTSLLLNPCLRSQYEDEDVDRTIKRSLEFDAMFARNHLYEIQRLLKDTKQLATTKNPNTADLESKITAALKSVTQALQVYTRHISKGSRIKYQQVVPIFQSISRVQSLLELLTGQRLFPLRQEIEVSCSYVKQVLLEMSATETKSVSTVSHKPAKVSTKQKHKPSADLSMYSRRHWRRNTANLARARFGPPTSKKRHKKSESATSKEAVGERLQIDRQEGDFARQNFSNRICDKSQSQPKEASNTKEVPFRNATRAVPEEHVTTMMEMIPNEPLEDSEICLDDCTFQALKLLNGAHVSLRKETQANEDMAFELVEKLSSDELNSPSSVSPSLPLSDKPDPPKDSPTMRKEEEVSKRKTSTKSSSEPSNVQLVCIKEGVKKLVPTATQDGEEANTAPVDEGTALTIQEAAREEAMEFQQKMIAYQKSSPNYKDGKALGIVDRLANHILKEMILDFQRNEMDEVIRILYNLEFE